MSPLGVMSCLTAFRRGDTKAPGKTVEALDTSDRSLPPIRSQISPYRHDAVAPRREERVRDSWKRGEALAERSGGKRLVIAFFETRAAGQGAAAEFTSETNNQVVGLLSRDRDGLLDYTEFGAFPSDDASDVRVVLGVVALALTGGTMPSRGWFLDARSDLSTDDVLRIGAELEADHAAIAVVEPRKLAESAVLRLTELGGKTESHRITDRGLQRAASAPKLNM